MTITLKEGDKLTVEFQDTDGSIEVEFTSEGLSVVANEPDDNGTVGTLWEAFFVEDTLRKEEV